MIGNDHATRRVALSRSPLLFGLHPLLVYTRIFP